MSILSEEERTRHNTFINSFRDETDRGAVVIGGAFLDDLLGELLDALYTRSTYINGRGEEKEFKHESFAKEFARKTNLAFALGLISVRDREDIDHVRILRNMFAHELGCTSFDVAKVSEICSKFAIVKDITDSGFSGSAHFNTPRRQFLWTVSVLHMRLADATKQTKRREVPRSLRVEFVSDKTSDDPEVVHMESTITTFGR